MALVSQIQDDSISAYYPCNLIINTAVSKWSDPAQLLILFLIFLVSYFPFLN